MNMTPVGASNKLLHLKNVKVNLEKQLEKVEEEIAYCQALLERAKQGVK